MPCIPDKIDCGGSCAFTSKEDPAKGEVTVTIKTTTIKLNALDILNGSKNSLAAITAAGSGAIAVALKGVVEKAFGGKKS